MIETKWKDYGIKAYLNPEPNDSVFGQGIYHHEVIVTKGENQIIFHFWGTEYNPVVNTHIDACMAFEWFIDRAIEGSGTVEAYCKQTGKAMCAETTEAYSFCRYCHAQALVLFGCELPVTKLLEFAAILHKSEQKGFKE